MQGMMTDQEFIGEIKRIRGMGPLGMAEMREFLKRPGHLDRLFDLAIRGARPKREPTRATRCRVPDDFPDQAQKDKAKAFWALRGRPDLAQRVDDQADGFRDYHIGRGTLGADWPRTWGTWMRNALRIEKPPPGWNDRTGKATESPEVWEWRLKAYHHGVPDDGIVKGYWRADWGPLPGSPGCRAPSIN